MNKPRLTILIPLSILVLAAIAITVLLICRSHLGKGWIVSNQNVVFRIGKEDKSDLEFKKTEWSGQKEYVCQIGINDKDSAFPAELYVHGSVYENYGVEKLEIVFTLERTEDLVLRLARGGEETTVVSIDGKNPLEVTSVMLGSGEGFQAGSYELELGTLDKGEHRISFSVKDDKKGNGSYQWDAIKLYSK
jgi:hypothetical protein